ncbi:MAG: hypothetical protein H6Q71_1187 [Firmicutes bacterium]|nr:hypothetical protein [Bacillota bacterium]
MGVQVQGKANKGILLTIAVLFLSLINIDVGLSNVALGDIFKAFPNVEPTLITMMVTLPLFIMIPVSILSGRLCYYFSKNILLSVGLVLYVIGGMSGSFFNGSIYQLLATRAILGIGAGIAAPLGTAIIGELFNEVERAKMLGWSNSFGSVMSILLTLGAGALCVINWKYTFLAYGIFLIVVIIQAIALPKLPPEKAYKTEVASSGISVQEFKGVAFSVLGLVISIIAVMLAGSLMMFKLAIFIMERGIGDAVTTANAFNCYSVGTILTGVVFMQVYKKLGRFTVPVSLVLMSLTYFITVNASSQWMIYLGMLLNGIGGGMFIPYMFTRATMVGSKAIKGLVIGLVYQGLFFGQVLGTFVEPTLKFFFGIQPIEFIFTFGGIAYGVYMIISLLWIFLAPETKSEAFSS